MAATKYFFLALLASCGTANHWAVDRVEAGDQAFDSAKLFYRSAEAARGLGLELIHTNEALQAYLVVHSQPVPAAKDNPHEAEAWLIIDGAQTYFIAIRHEGGQRLKLPETTRDALIAALKTGQTVTIQLRGYKTTIDPQGFNKFFNKLENKPLLSPSLLKARLI